MSKKIRDDVLIAREAARYVRLTLPTSTAISGRAKLRPRRSGDAIGLPNQCSISGWAKKPQPPLMSVGEISWSGE